MSFAEGILTWIGNIEINCLSPRRYHCHYGSDNIPSDPHCEYSLSFVVHGDGLGVVEKKGRSKYFQEVAEEAEFI